MKKKIFTLFLLLILLLLASTAQAMSSPNYSLDWLVPLSSAGGGTAASAGYTASYTLGQTAVGTPSSTNFSLRLGFWQEFLRRFHLWLPVIEK